MSTIVQFFVATRASARAALLGGPSASRTVVECGNFDVEEALLDWEAHCAGRSFEEIAEAGLPEVLAEIEDGPAVFSLSDTLVRSLGTASSSEIDELARWWVERKAEDGAELDPFVALGILRELAELIRGERDSEEHVYCWAG
ncbi:hypothetical protein [Actinomadura miaoliensis]|uniref:DUF4259 domain-containing protein n=1 Tax=Actinomadura miaoliensis TaxID=430685 RepID=A0ABP7WAM6_9ACTN